MRKPLDKIVMKIDSLWNGTNLWLGKKNRHELVVWAFFLTYLFVGSQIFDDYGISMDEPIQRKHGMVSLEYVNRILDNPLSIPIKYNIDVNKYDHKEYGVIFQMGCYVLEQLFNLQDIREVFLLRHILVFLIFCVALFYFNKILFHRFKSHEWAIFGTIMLILTPRLFANSFYNPKDIPLLSWCVLAIYTMLQFVRFRNIKYAILHALMCAMAINTRITAIYIPLVTIVYFALSLLLFNFKLGYFIRKYMPIFTLYLILLPAFTILFWPYLWQDPINHLLYSFNSMGQFHWYNAIYYMGDYIYPGNLPWHYIPIWIAITTPFLYTILFIVGVIILMIKVFKSFSNCQINSDTLTDLVMLAMILIPLFAIIILNSTLYNGWRHLYFIYPYIIVIAVSGAHALYSYIKADVWIDEDKTKMKGNHRKRFIRLIYNNTKYTLLIAFSIYQLRIGYQMYKLHPHQNVYFSELAGEKAGERFDMDYYGLCFKQGIQYLLSNINADTLFVSYSSFSGNNNHLLLSPQDRSRLNIVDKDEAQYYITNYKRNLQNRDKIEKNLFPLNMKRIYSISVGGNELLGIYDLRQSYNRKEVTMK